MTGRLVPLALLAAALAAGAIASTASAATQRYASPTGTGDCSSASPCSIKQAVEGTTGSEEVIVTPGDYPLTATLKTPYPITIHGVAGQPRPRLLFSGVGQQGLHVLYGSTLRYVEVDQTGPWSALNAVDASVDQVIAKGTETAKTTAWIESSMIRNSIVVASGDNGVALQTASSPAPRTGTYRNVTAIATGSGGTAIKAGTLGGGYANVLARNVIARGGPGGYSFHAYTDNSGTAKITVSKSNWLDETTNGAGASIVDGGGNQSSAPAFVDAAGGDYRQAAGSPTIDAGLTEFIDGPLDVDGDPRQIGTIDIGADEFVVTPAATTGPATAVTEHSATLSGSVNANGAPTSYHFEYGPTTAYGSTTPTADAGSGTGAVAATATLGSLSQATTYHYRLVATNSGVTTKGADHTFTTATPPPPAPTSPPPSPTSPPPSPTPTTPAAAFGGVKLASTRLTFGGRSIALKLSCPAGTVGRCSGRTKLTARPRRSSAHRVTLGRAAFSIAAGRQDKVKVRVTRAGRRLLSKVRRLRGKDRNAARDAAGQSKTTMVAVTIRRRHR